MEGRLRIHFGGRCHAEGLLWRTEGGEYEDMGSGPYSRWNSGGGIRIAIGL